MENEPLLCSVCHQPVLAEQYFCANCGNSLKEKPVPISLASQIGIYALSLLLPPLGLWPGIKYLAKKSPEAKKVGAIAVALTVLSSIVMIWWIFSLFQDYLAQMSLVLQ